MTDKTQYKKTLEQFLEYLSDIIQLYRSAVPILKEELDSIVRDDIDSLNESLKCQQALFLKTKSFDEQTEFFLSALGIKAENLTEMARQLPAKDGLRFFNLLGEFEPVMAEVNYYRDKCRMLLQNKLYTIGKALSKPADQKDNITYNQNASEINAALFPKSFETKI